MRGREREVAIVPGEEPLEDTSATAGSAVESPRGLKEQSTVPPTPPEDRRRSLSLHLMGLLPLCFRVKHVTIMLIFVLKRGVSQLSTLLNCLAKQY